MTELYINNKKADITDDIDIAITYQSIDTDKPTAQKNSYSKSVNLKGTPANNSIFSDAWSLGRDIMDISFDPKKRVDFKILENSDIIDAGYCQLDSVKVQSGQVTYSVTLYGGLGDFFFNLQTDEETGEEKTLEDLTLGIDGEDGTICYWDKDFINSGWTKLKATRDETDMSADNWIVAAPVYGGYYDDFESDKTLFDYSSTSGTSYFSRYIGSFPSTYNPVAGWYGIESGRDMDEWEVRDLRSAYQRPAIKMSLLLDAISKPENNGGYEVEWDPEITSSAYWKDTWLVLNRFDFEDDDTANGVFDLTNFLAGLTMTRGSEVGSYRNNGTYIRRVTGTTDTYNLSTYKNPSITINPKFVVNYADRSDKANKVYTYGVCKELYSFDGNHSFRNVNDAFFGGWYLEITAYIGNTKVKDVAKTFISTNRHDFVAANAGNEVWLSYRKRNICSIIGGGITEDDIVWLEQDMSRDNQTYMTNEPITIEGTLPSSDGVRLVFDFKFISISQYDMSIHTFWPNKVISWSTSMTTEENDTNGIYDGTIDPGIQKTNITKRVLFGSTKSPYEYLIGFTRMIGARYICDPVEKKVKILLRKNYYLDGITDLTQYTDFSNQEVKPNTADKKYYLYGFEQPETYASDLYNQSNRVEYGKILVNTGYEFNCEKEDLFEDIPYESAIPYLHHSIYLNRAQLLGVTIPAQLMGPTQKVLVWNSSSENHEEVKYGWGTYNTQVKMPDVEPRLCMFGDDNSASDITDCLVFYTGWGNTGQTYFLTDNMRIMTELCEGPCYLFSNREMGRASKSAASDVRVLYIESGVPTFSKYLISGDTYSDSLDFSRPSQTFTGNQTLYSDGICIYDRYWKNYIDDIYHRNSRELKIKVILPMQPKDALRHFFKIGTSLYVIKNINNYDPRKAGQPVEVEFIKINSISNYIG